MTSLFANFTKIWCLFTPSMGDFGSLAEMRKRKEQHTGLQGLNNTAVYSNLHWIPVCREEFLATCMWPHKI